MKMPSPLNPVSKIVGMQPPSKRQKVAESGHDGGGEDNEHQTISSDEYARAVLDLVRMG